MNFTRNVIPKHNTRQNQDKRGFYFLISQFLEINIILGLKKEIEGYLRLKNKNTTCKKKSIFRGKIIALSAFLKK